jgi:solute carrier family 25 iron transporter 28/37
MHFGTYEFVKEVAGGDREGLRGVGGTALAGAMATTASDAFMNPFDGESPVGKSIPVKLQADHDFPHPRSAVIKQRMQLQSSTYRSVIACAKHVHATEGLRAFYISYPTTLLMNIPLQAVQFSVYEILKSFLNPTGEYSPSTHIAAGGVAGGVAAALTTPLDVAKVRALPWTRP